MSVADEQAFRRRRPGGAATERPVLDDKASAQAVAEIEQARADRLELALQQHYPNITPAGIAAIEGDEWDLLSSVAKLPPSAEARERIRARVIAERRRAAAPSTEDPFRGFPREAR